MSAVTDTSTEADRVQYELWARMTTSERSARALQLSRLLLESSRRLIDAAHPQATRDELIALYVTAQYGDELGNAVMRKLRASSEASR